MHSRKGSARVEAQVQHQHRLDRERMTAWIPWLFVAGLIVSLAGLYAFVRALRLGEGSVVTVAVYAVFVVLFGIAVGQWLFWSAFIKPRIVPYFTRELEPWGGAASSAFLRGRATYLALRTKLPSDQALTT